MYQTAMKTTQLGRTGLEVTRLGFGSWAIGGGNWEFGWGPQDDDESIAAIHHALELGINWIDTAAAYGFGRSEQGNPLRRKRQPSSAIRRAPSWRIRTAKSPPPSAWMT